MVEKCNYCDLPGTFYIWSAKGILKVTDPMIRITTKKSVKALYAHKNCHV